MSILIVPSLIVLKLLFKLNGACLGPHIIEHGIISYVTAQRNMCVEHMHKAVETTTRCAFLAARATGKLVSFLFPSSAFLSCLAPSEPLDLVTLERIASAEFCPSSPRKRIASAEFCPSSSRKSVRGFWILKPVF
jgi:hypothetical protein